MTDHRNARLLLAILRERWSDAEAIARQAPPQDAAFAETARACDVHPYVHALLARADRADLVGDQAWKRLSALRHKVRVDNLLLLSVLERALDLLLAAGIVPVALKGVDTLHRLYAAFDERTLDDIDLLVGVSEVDGALAALEGAGYELPAEPERTHWLRSSFEMPLASPGPTKVLLEIHWSLGQEKRYRLDAAEILERSVPAEVAGRRVRRLDDHDAVAHLLLHHLQHYFDRRLKWALDLRRITAAPGFDWGIVAERLDAWGGRAAAGMALLHLRKLFPDLVPERAVRLLPAAAWRRAWTAPLRSRHPLELFRSTRRRSVQLFLAGALLDRPSELPAYLLHRSVRDRSAQGVESAAPLDRGPGHGKEPT